MKRQQWVRAACFSSVTFAGLVAVTTPLAQRYGWAGRGVDEFVARLLGFCVIWTTILVVVATPILAIGVRVSRCGKNRPIAGLIGATAVVSPFLVRLVIDVGWNLFVLNIRELLTDPVRMASEWVPFVASGGLFGWLLAPTSSSRNVR